MMDQQLTDATLRVELVEGQPASDAPVVDAAAIRLDLIRLQIEREPVPKTGFLGRLTSVIRAVPDRHSK